MRAADLPNLSRFIPNGQLLRTELAKAISSVETQAKRGTTLPASAATLDAFLDEAIAAIAAVGNYSASIAITPGTVTIDLSAAQTQQLVVTSTQLDGGSEVVTGSATYESSDPTKATVSVGGLVTPVGVGTTTITATYKNRSDTQLVTVVA